MSNVMAIEPGYVFSSSIINRVNINLSYFVVQIKYIMTDSYSRSRIRRGLLRESGRKLSLRMVRVNIT